MKKSLLLAALGILLWTLPPADAFAALAVDSAAVAPMSVAVGVAVPVTVTATISDPSVLPDGVNLQRLDSAGRVVGVIGLLRDDGVNGDAAAGDRVFSLRFTLFEQTLGPVVFRVSAAFRGSLLRAFSPQLSVNVTGASATGINILAPGDLAYLNTSPIIVSGRVGDLKAGVVVNGINAAVSGGSFQASVPLVEGTNTLTAVATNTGGTTSTASVQVTLDTTPPHLTIESPAEGLSTTDATATVSGTVNDIVVGTVNAQQAQVTVNGVAAQVANRSFLVAGVPLALGLNTIQAIARDRSGNSVTSSVHVTRLPPTVPFISIISGNNQSGPVSSSLAAPLVVALKTGTGQPVANTPVVFRVTDNNGLVTGGGSTASSIAISTDAAGRAQTTLKLGSRAGAGSNRVEASATGFNGTATFTATGVPTAAGLITVDSGNNQTGAITSKLAFPFVVVVTDAGFNRLGNVPVTFTVRQGGGTLSGKATFQMNTDPDGRAAAFLTLGSEPGLDNNVVEATFSGNTGQPAAFVASAKAPGNAADTRISGVVLDNSNIPIEGVTIRLFKTHQGNNNNTPIPIGTPVKTNAQGQFLMTSAPVGFFKLMADGTTVEAARGVFPTLEYDIVTVAGQDNTVGMPLLLPLLDTVNKLCVDETTGGTLTLPDVPGFSLTVAPGSATFPGGSRSGCISVSTVNADKSPMTPGFGQQPRFLITIQPVGTTFNPPAPITMPNIDGLLPGQVTELYSYDHDLAAFTAIGTGTVSEDGLLVRSDPGVGILKAGWHCGGNPNPSGNVASLSVTIAPTEAVKNVNDVFTLTASGSPPLDAVYSWALIATEAGDDVSAAQLETSPSCPNASSCAARVKAVKAGALTLRVRFRCTTTGSEVTADARIIISTVDIVGHDGQGGSAIAEADEETRGAVSVPNTNDTNNNGTVDTADNAVTGERDLIKILLKKPTPANGGKVKLTLTGDGTSVKLWRASTKTTEETAREFDLAAWPASGEHEFYLEGLKTSGAVRDIEVLLDYKGAKDTLKVTFVSAVVSRTFITRAASGASNDLPTDLDGATALATIKDHLAQDGSRYGHGTMSTNGTVDQRIGGRVLFEFEVKPTKSDAIPGVVFDVTRQLTFRDYTIANGSGTVTLRDSRTMSTTDSEAPNDDGHSDDEDNAPKNDHIYSFDAPSESIVAGGNAFVVSRNTWFEFVRVRFTGAFANTNGTTEGSRASAKAPWHTIYYQRRGPDGRLTNDTAQTSASAPVFAGTGNGTAATTLGANPTTEGFTATYAAATRTWTLTGTGGGSVTDTVAAAPAGTTWTLTVPNKVTLTLTQGATPFANGASFTFSVFKSAVTKENVTATGSIDPTTGP